MAVSEVERALGLRTAKVVAVLEAGAALPRRRQLTLAAAAAAVA